MAPLKAVLFDMDGTLTEPNIDWADLRAQVGVPAGVGIMEHIYGLSEADQQEADGIVRRIEMASVTAARANPGLREMFAALDALPVKRALITNNHRAAMDHVVSTFDLRFDLLLSREDGLLKPAPDLLLLAMERFGIGPDECVYVGDGRYDREASAAAGVRFIELLHDRGREHEVEHEVIHGLHELVPRLTNGS